MKLTLLGTGTSHGIPQIGCDCAVCTSNNPKNNRLRCSALFESQQGNILIDGSADFRQQALRYRINTVTDVLVTHGHADHIFGLDDTRIFCLYQKHPIRLYLNEQANCRIREVYSYVYDETIQRGGGVPRFENIIIEPAICFPLQGMTITPLRLLHGNLPTLGYRINNVAYLTDCSDIPADSLALLQGLDVLILDALRIKPHATHFNLEQAIKSAQQIKAKQTYFTHICHHLDHEQTNQSLPASMELAYDGLTITCE